MTEYLKSFLYDEGYILENICNTNIIYINNFHLTLSDIFNEKFLNQSGIQYKYDKKEYTYYIETKKFLKECIKSNIFYLKKETLNSDAFIYYKLENEITGTQLNCFNDIEFKQYIRNCKLKNIIK